MRKLQNFSPFFTFSFVAVGTTCNDKEKQKIRSPRIKDTHKVNKRIILKGIRTAKWLGIN